MQSVLRKTYAVKKKKTQAVIPHSDTLRQDFGMDQSLPTLQCLHSSLELRTSQAQNHLVCPKNMVIYEGYKPAIKVIN